MATNSIKYISQLSNILKVQTGKITISKDLLPMRVKDNKSTTGFLNIIFDILKESNAPLSGKSAEDRAEVRQWIEYALVYLGSVDNSQNIHPLLRELNDVLLTKTFLVSDVLTVADIILYCALQSIMANLTYLEKEKYINLSRWFDNIQHLDNIKKSSKPVDFRTIYLVTVAPSRH